MANSKRTLGLHKESVSCPQFWMTNFRNKTSEETESRYDLTLYSDCFHKTAMPTEEIYKTVAFQKEAVMVEPRHSGDRRKEC